MTTEFGAMSLMFTRSAAGLNATSTSGWSPGVWMSFAANWIWKPETPGSVPAGARISAGKSGKVDRSFPTIAVVVVNWPPTCWTPSPESPAKRMVTLSRTSRLRPVFGAVASVVMRTPSRGRIGTSVNIDLRPFIQDGRPAEYHRGDAFPVDRRRPFGLPPALLRGLPVGRRAVRTLPPADRSRDETGRRRD